VKPGEMFALVGKSGCGKSSLASLLVGLHMPTNGAVKYDGNRLQDLELGALRRQIGVVVQKPYIFGATIRANITMFDPAVPQADIERAARMACIHDDIMKMPLGYDTPLTAAGSSLSGGQRQRIALARALVRNPRILLLDEATSALDNVTEQEVMKNLRESGSTIFVVAHRLSTVKASSFILVMDEGALIEGGTHEQLLRMNGLYAELVRAQDPQAAGLQKTQGNRAIAPTAQQAQHAQQHTQRPPMQAQRPQQPQQFQPPQQAQQQWQQPAHPQRPAQQPARSNVPTGPHRPVQQPPAMTGPHRPVQQPVQPVQQPHQLAKTVQGRAVRTQQKQEQRQEQPPQQRQQRQQAQVFALPKAPATLAKSDDADPTVRRGAFSRPSIANDVADDDATVMRKSSEHAKYDRSGERIIPQQEDDATRNVIPLHARRAAGGHRR
jgi:ABC-type methionine transport system ATPase subunit